MPIAIFKAHRYPETDRAQLAQAALDWCRAVRTIEGARARFYWSGPNDVGFVVEADTSLALTTATGPWDGSVSPPADLSQALFRLADLAAPQPAELWVEPGVGDTAYRSAGRA